MSAFGALATRRVLAGGETPRVVRQGLRDVLPVALSVAPFGLVIGVTGREIGQGMGDGLLGGFIVFGGSAHLAALTMLGAGAELLAILAAVLVIQARLVVYGAALEPHFRSQPGWFRWLAPHFLVDQTYALAAARTDMQTPQRFRNYWLTLGVGIGVVWLAAMGVGLAVGQLLPASSPLEFAATAVFVGLLAPKLRDRRTITIAATAATVAAFASPLPSGLGLIVGVLSGLAVAAIAEVVRR